MRLLTVVPYAFPGFVAGALTAIFCVSIDQAGYLPHAAVGSILLFVGGIVLGGLRAG